MPTGMTTDHAASVRGRDLRRLLNSDLPDPVLVLTEGRIDIVADDRDRVGLEIVSRTEFLRRTGRTTFTDTELELQATQLSTAVDKVGG
jgi:hypothetical protein